eukprot:g4781.t1
MNSRQCCSFIVLVLFANVCLAAPSTRCRYESIGFGITFNEQLCRERCKSYTKPDRSGCVAYQYQPATEVCRGYFLDYSDEYYYYDDDTCEILSDADLSFDVDSEEAMAPEPVEEGCSLAIVQLGVAATAKDCEEECRFLKSGGYYGGCAAWFYNEGSERCRGLLSRSSTTTVCGLA